MPENMNEVASRIADTASDGASRVTHAAKEVGQAAKETGRRVVASVDAQRDRAANVLESAAASLHTHASNDWPERVAGPAHYVGDGVKRTAEYIRDHRTSEMIESVGGAVKRHPGRSIAAAAVAGFFVGHWMSSKR